MLSSDFLTIYASSPMDMGVSSYVIYSIFGFLFLVWLAGGSPAASHFLLLRQKKSNQRKGDPTVCGVFGVRVQIRRAYGSPRRVRCFAPQRNWRLTPITQPAVLGPAGVSCKLASLRQARSLIRLALRSSAHTEGLGDRDRSRERIQMRIRGLAPSPFGGRLGWGPAAVKLQQINSSSHLKTACCIELPTPAPIQRAPIPTFPQRGKELTGFLRARIRSHPVLPGPRLRVAFSLLTFFWRSKRQVSRRRATPGQQPSAEQQNQGTTREGKEI
jgi:hypothetical protein